MAKNKKTSKKIPTEAAVMNGCYIDFEGFAPNPNSAHPPPVLIGIYNRNGSGIFEQVVFTKAYRWAAEDAGEDHPVRFVTDRKGFITELVNSSSISCPVFAFTEHEFRVIAKETGWKITRRYRDVHRIAKTWFNQNPETRGKPDSWDLVDMARALGLDAGQKLQRGGMTDRLRIVREYSKSENAWKGCPKAVKKAWRDVLLHNKTDVMLTFEIMKKLRDTK